MYTGQAGLMSPDQRPQQAQDNAMDIARVHATLFEVVGMTPNSYRPLQPYVLCNGRLTQKGCSRSGQVSGALLTHSRIDYSYTY